MASVKQCFVCDSPIYRGEPRAIVDGAVIHPYCDPGSLAPTCDTEDCAYRWCIHAGECLT